MNLPGHQWTLPGHDADYRISQRLAAAVDREAQVSVVPIKPLLRSWFSREATRPIIIDMYEALGGSRPLGFTTLEYTQYIQRLEERLSRAFQDGELVVRKLQHPRLGSLTPPRPAPPSQPPEPTPERTFIAIRLEDDEGQPIASERYRIVLPDGTTREGKLDGQGTARVNNIPPGQCRVSFPGLKGSSAS